MSSQSPEKRGRSPPPAPHSAADDGGQSSAMVPASGSSSRKAPKRKPTVDTANYLAQQVHEQAPRGPSSRAASIEASRRRLGEFTASRSHQTSSSQETPYPKQNEEKEESKSDLFYGLVGSTFLYVCPNFSLSPPMVVFSSPDPNLISVNIGNSFIDVVTAAACTTTECERPSKLVKAIFDLVVFSIVAFGWFQKQRNQVRAVISNKCVRVLTFTAHSVGQGSCYAAHIHNGTH